MIAACVLCLICIVLLIVVFHCFLRWKKAFQNLKDAEGGRKKLYDKSIDSSMDIFFSLLNLVAMHGSSPELLRREAERLLIVNPEEEGNMLSDISLIADSRFFGIISYLKKNYPYLNGHDLVFCSLLCFKPSAIAVMALYNHNNQACYYNKRGRVMRRMGLPKGQYNLEKFLGETVKALEKEAL